MKHNIYIILLLPILLASCGIYTKYEKVDTVPDNLFGIADSVAADTVGMAAMPWRELFTDPMLQSLIDEGLHNNSDLNAAQLRIEEAEATLRSARLALLPSFALAPQGTISSFDGGKATKAYSLPLTASWELDVFGRMRNARKQANALYQQSIDYKQAVHSQLVAGIANTYYTLLMLDSQLQIATETQQSWQNTVESTQALVDAGMANSSAVDQMTAATQGIDITILDLKEQINQAENSMAKLLHSSPRHIERSSLNVQTTPDNIALGLPIDILSRRPDVRAAERQLEQAFYGVNMARSAFYPQITLSGSAGWTNSAGSIIQNPAKFLAIAMGNITQPLFARGQLTGQLKIAKAQQQEAQLAFEQALLNAGIEVNDALTALHTALQKTDIYALQIESLQQAYEKSQLLMDYGNSTYLEVLTAQQSLLSAQLQQTANRFTVLQSVVTLYNALGGGTY